MTFRTWDEWLANRTPVVRERIQRLNAKRKPGEIIRGYRPHRRASDPITGNIGYQQFVAAHGADAWRALPPICIIRSGKRMSVRREDVRDCLWSLAADNPLRAAFKRDGKWYIPGPNGEVEDAWH